MSKRKPVKKLVFSSLVTTGLLVGVFYIASIQPALSNSAQQMPVPQVNQQSQTVMTVGNAQSTQSGSLNSTNTCDPTQTNLVMSNFTENTSHYTQNPNYNYLQCLWGLCLPYTDYATGMAQQPATYDINCAINNPTVCWNQNCSP